MARGKTDIEKYWLVGGMAKFVQEDIMRKYCDLLLSNRDAGIDYNKYGFKDVKFDRDKINDRF